MTWLEPTGRREVVQMSDDIRVRGGKHTLVASGDTMTIDGNDTYDLRALKAVSYDAVRRHLNGAYLGTDFKIQFKQDKRTRMFLLATDHRDENIGGVHAAEWNSCVLPYAVSRLTG